MIKKGDAELRDAVFDNFSFMLGLFKKCSFMDYDERADNIIFSSRIDFPLFNGVYATRIARNAEPRVAECLGIFKKRRVSAYWWIDPRSRPSALGALLERKGLVPKKPSPAMAVRLAAWERPRTINGKVKVVRVSSGKDLRLWNDIFCRSFEIPVLARGPYLDAFRAIGFDRPRVMAYYLAFLDGRPVGCAQLICGKGVAGLWGIGVLKSFRHQGAGHALTARSMADAKANGCRIAILTASEMGLPLYERLGFKTVCEYSKYLYKPG